MKPELRALLFTLTILVLAPGLYAFGDWLGGLPLAVTFPSVAVGASFLYARSGERPPSGRDPAKEMPPT